MEKYLDVTLTPEERAEDLLSKLSLAEKMAQVNCLLYKHGDFEKQVLNGIGQVSTLEIRENDTIDSVAEEINDLQKRIMETSDHKIPAIFHMEGLCGPLMQEGMSFPSGIGRGSGWDPELEEKIGEVVGRQERAVGITQTLAPVLDISRDPRMGRQCETYGEDPTLAAALGSSYVKGIQAESAGRRTDAMAKHFLGFHDSIGAIHGAHVEVGERTLQEIYGKPFQAAIEEQNLRGIMPCYCSVNGVPASASKEILTDLLREEMGFDGLVGADYSAIINVHNVQGMYESKAKTGLACMDAGMDVEFPVAACYNRELAEMFEDGRADIEILNTAVRHVLTAKFRMGLFEHPFALTGDELHKQMHQAEDCDISLKAARQSMVLLKNRNQVLPISKNIKKIALIGCHANNARFLFGGYTHLSMVEAMRAAVNSLAGVDASNSGEKPMKTVPGTKIQADETEEFNEILTKLYGDQCKNIREELAERLDGVEISYAYGYHKAGDDTSYFEEALNIAKDADLILLTLGGKNGSGSIASMGEGVDGTDINLPHGQELFIGEAAKLGIPMVGIHLDGRPISSDIADEKLDAILEAWNPSQTGAQAIADVLTGVYNPGGKLPVCVARASSQVPIFYNHLNGSAWHQGDSIGFQDYVDMPHTPRYFFGQGLSYTEFTYSDLELSKTEVDPKEEIAICCKVTNTGKADGTEIVQLYIKDKFASVARPVKELAGFARVELRAGETKTVTFTMKASQMAFLDRKMRWKVERGNYEVQMGASSEDIRLRGDYKVISDWITTSRDRGFYAAVSIK